MRLQDEYGAVRRERVLHTDRDAAWSQLADPRALEGWLADEVDLPAVEEGAEGTLRWDEGVVRDVVVEEVAERRRVVMRWTDPEADGTGPAGSIVELALDDHEEGTLLRVVELPLVALRAIGAELAGVPAGRPAGPLAVAA